jgi:4-diphosphocytidyl-2-C-methyl-D-erythritol kinase
MENDLESVTMVDYPVLTQIKQWLLARGALGALMSGSGPTVFGIFRLREDAQAIAEQASKLWQDCWVKATVVQGASLSC